jgi:hypothetical protein
VKKTYFNPGMLNQNRLPNIVSRRIFGHSHEGRANRAYLTDGGEDGDDEADVLIKKIKNQVSKQLATRATKDELKEIQEQLKFLKPNEDGTGGFPLDALRQMADADKGVMAILAAQGLELKRLETTLKNQPKDMSIRSQAQAWMDANKEAIAKIKAGEQNATLPAFDIQLATRAAANPMLPSNTLNGSAYLPRPEYAPGLVDVLRAEPVFWDYIRKGTTGSAAYVWVNKTNPQGEAAFIAPGVYKPNISFEINTEISNAKKIAASEKMAIELLEDIDGFTSWVEDELRFKVMEKVNTTLMTGVASSTVPAGIQTLSVPFATTLGLTTTNANNWDAVRAAVAQLRYALFKGRIVAFMNPIDYANMVMTKAQNQGQTFIPPVTGATIVEDPNIPVGYLQVAAMDYYKILIYKGFTITWGLENDDFTKNLRTAIGEMRLHQFHSENHDGFAIYDTFTNIITALNA